MLKTNGPTIGKSIIRKVQDALSAGLLALHRNIFKMVSDAQVRRMSSRLNDRRDIFISLKHYDYKYTKESEYTH